MVRRPGGSREIQARRMTIPWNLAGHSFFMNRVVIPLSAIGPQPFVLAPFINGILIHIVGIGIPTALIAAGISYRR
jgi:hypothetical protein